MFVFFSLLERKKAIASIKNTKGFENKTFDPFLDAQFDKLSLTHTYFKNVINQCSFYDPKDIDKHVSENKLTMIHLNARSLINKFDEIKLFLSTHKWDLVLVSETWLNDNIEKLFCINNY